MDRQIDQFEQPPNSPFSYAPTTPAETVIADNDESNTNNNDANTTAIPQNEMPADEDLPPVPSDDSEVEDGQNVAVNTLPANDDQPAAAVNTLPADSGNTNFQQRRRNMDQGEMAWLRNFQRQRRPLDEPKNDSEQKRQRIYNSVEVGFYSSNGEHNKFVGDMLPDGWTYDEISNSFVLGKTQDFWSVEEDFLSRNYVIARDSSWRPTAGAIKDVPIKLGDLQALKITMHEGASTMMVDSVAAAERKISKDGFFGKTLFPLTKEAAQKLKMPYINLKKKISKSTSGSMETHPLKSGWL